MKCISSLFPADGGFDEVDNGPLEVEEPQELCSYLLIDSRDQLSINLTPYAMDLISEVSQVWPHLST